MGRKTLTQAQLTSRIVFRRAAQMVGFIYSHKDQLERYRLEYITSGVLRKYKTLRAYLMARWIRFFQFGLDKIKLGT